MLCNRRRLKNQQQKLRAATSGAFQLIAVSLLAKEQRSSVYENPGCGPG